MVSSIGATAMPRREDQRVVFQILPIFRTEGSSSSGLSRSSTSRSADLVRARLAPAKQCSRSAAPAMAARDVAGLARRDRQATPHRSAVIGSSDVVSVSTRRCRVLGARIQRSAVRACARFRSARVDGRDCRSSSAASCAGVVRLLSDSASFRRWAAARTGRRCEGRQAGLTCGGLGRAGRAAASCRRTRSHSPRYRWLDAGLFGDPLGERRELHRLQEGEQTLRSPAHAPRIFERHLQRHVAGPASPASWRCAPSRRSRSGSRGACAA